MSDLPSFARLRTDAPSFPLMDLTRALQQKIFKYVASDDPCGALLELCDMNPTLCPEEVFQTACSSFRYSTKTIRDAFLATRLIPLPPSGQRWYVCFRELCARPKLHDCRFVLRDAVRYACDNNMTHPTYGHISYWDVSNITNMAYAFLNERTFNEDITLWDVSSATNMRAMFVNAETFNNANRPLEWDVSRVTDMSAMFQNAHAFNQPLKWNVSSVKDMNGMFYDARAFDRPLDWDVSHVTNMMGMFAHADAFNQPLDWDVSRVTNMNAMFYDARAFNQPIDRLFMKDPPNWANTQMHDMFRGSAQAPLPLWSIRR